MTHWDPDHSPTGLQAVDYIAHLWKRRWIIMVATAATLVGTYLGVRLFHDNQYESRALVLVREQPRTTSVESDRPGMFPPAFRSMFTSDETIQFVRNQYNAMVESGALPAEDGHRRITTPLEKLRPWFQAQSATTVDTTVTTEFSPVIELRARGMSPGMARTLADLWVLRCLNRYGNIMDEEAAFLLEASFDRREDLADGLEETQAEQERLRQALRLVDAKIASRTRQLTNARIPYRRDLLADSVLGFGMQSGARETNVTVEGQQAGEPGLYERRTELEVALASATADEDQADAARRTLAEVERKITQIEGEIATLRQEAAGLQGQLARAAMKNLGLEYAARLNATLISQAESALRPVDLEGEDFGASKFSALRVVAEPSLPDLRVWPKRTLIAGLAALSMLVLCLGLFLSECYVSRALAVANTSPSGRQGGAA